MKDIAFALATSVITWALSHLYYQKKHKTELENMLLARVNDLSEKYIKLNSAYIDLIDEVNEVKRENQHLKLQITCLNKNRKNGSNNTPKY